MVLCYVAAVIMLIAGIVFFTGKAASYIKGYQTMPEEEKRNINIKPLCRNISVVLFAAAIIFGIAGYSELFRSEYMKWAILGWLIAGCADVIYIGKSGRFINNAASSRK